MTVQEPQKRVSGITRFLVGRNLDTKLEPWLNAAFPPASAIHREMFVGNGRAVLPGASIQFTKP